LGIKNVELIMKDRIPAEFLGLFFLNPCRDSSEYFISIVNERGAYGI